MYLIDVACVHLVLSRSWWHREKFPFKISIESEVNVRNGFILNNSVRSRMMIFWSSKSFYIDEQQFFWTKGSDSTTLVTLERSLFVREHWLREEERRGEKKSFVRVRARPLAVYFQSERWGEHVVAVILRQVSRFVDSFVCLFNREREKEK